MLSQADAMACIQALKISADMGMGRVIVETGAQELRTALLDDEEDRSLDAAVISFYWLILMDLKSCIVPGPVIIVLRMNLLDLRLWVLRWPDGPC